MSMRDKAEQGQAVREREKQIMEQQSSERHGNGHAKETSHVYISSKAKV